MKATRLAFTTAALWLASTLLHAQDIESLKRGVVRVIAVNEGRRVTGSGFIVALDAQRAHILTVVHAIEGDPLPKVEFYRQGIMPARVVHAEAEGDGIALLEVRGSLPAALNALDLGDARQLAEAQEVQTIGFPAAGVPWSVLTGRFAGRQGRRLAFQGIAEEGNSGGPVIAAGKVVGMVTGAARSFTYATSTAALRDYLDGQAIAAGSGDMAKPAMPRIEPMQARAQLGQLGLHYDENTFVRRAAAGDLQAVLLFLDAGMAPDTPDSRGQTALMWAAGEGKLDVVRLLLDRGADAGTALAWAAGNDRMDVVQFLSSRKPAHAAIDSALAAAATLPHTRMLDRLLGEGADPNAQDTKGETALMRAAAHARIDNVKALLAHGARADLTTTNGVTALHAAIERDTAGDDEARARVAIVRELLQHGADMEARADLMAIWRPNPLLLAVERGLPDIALVLLAHGADPNARTGHTDGARAEHSVLMFAAGNSLAPVVTALLARGADPNAGNDRGQTALMEVAGSNGSDDAARLAIIDALRAAGADLDATSQAGWTALMRAADNGDTRMVQALLAAGARIDAKNHDGDDALTLARRKRFTETADVLARASTQAGPAQR